MTLRPCNTCGKAHHGGVNSECNMLTDQERKDLQNENSKLDEVKNNPISEMVD